MQHFDPRQLDKFYTVPGVATECLAAFIQTMRSKNQPQIDLWVEPSAGSGAFLDILPAPRIGVDLEPEGREVIRADFLTWAPVDPNQRIAIVGNPPFGKNASAAVAFFNHAASFCCAIGMVLPRTFEKASIHRRLNRNFHLHYNKALPLQSFTFLGTPYAVPTTFQVWIKADTIRVDPPVRKRHEDFEFVEKTVAEFAFQRVGVRAGSVKTDFSHVSPSSHYFLRPSPSGPSDLISRINALDFSEIRLRTAGNPSIAKGELIEEYDRTWGNVTPS
jgi:predicted RNA methylase